MKKYLPDIMAILLFAALSFVYFFPADIEGRILFQHDSAAGVGAGQEAIEYLQQTGERTRWTNSLFGGMPTYQLSPSYDSIKPLQWISHVYSLFLPDYIGLTFTMMLGFFILLRVFGIPTWLSALGGIIWAFSSYFFIIIAAGHLWKFITLTYIPPTIAGMVLAYRGRYLLGGAITALFLSLQILSNHIQMSYYFLFVMLFMFLAYLETAWKTRNFNRFFKATGTLIVAALLGVCANLSNLYHTYEYSKESMRGKSELKPTEASAEQHTGNGLERDYITQWSYGIGETVTLLVPNVKGGASVPLSQSQKAMAKADPQYEQTGLYSSLTQYFGDQPMTSGPVYVGAFVMVLFLLGCFVVKGPMKWALLGATMFSILLSWGRNFQGLTDFFIDYVPMYNKFRAVSSILVIAEFTIPLLAILGLKEILAKPEILKKEKTGIIVTGLLTAGLSLVLMINPEIFFSSYSPQQETAALQQIIPAEMLGPILANIKEMRLALVTADAQRSLMIIVVGSVLLWLFCKGKLNKGITIAAVTVLCVADMWSVNKRYLYDDQFVPKSEQTTTFQKTPADEMILADQSLDYRVLNLATNTFNENNTSYWHKSIGGYHPAKLRRYQDMIDHHISKEMQAASQAIAAAGGRMDSVDSSQFRVLNMLNTKYLIFPAGQQGGTIAVQNPYAYGNAWFVSQVKYVNTPDEEINLLNSIDQRHTAVADSRFKETLKGVTAAYTDSAQSIKLQSYQPNKLVYEAHTAKDGVAVFSEIFYPGWQATIDGQPADIARVNYILRAVNIPAGEHTVEMWFDPTTLHVTETIAYTAIILMVLGIAACVWLEQRKKKAL